MVGDLSLDSGSQSTGGDGVEEKPAHGTAFLEAVEITTTGQGIMIHMVVYSKWRAFHSKTALCPACMLCTALQ